jgi:hypothetical protein
LFTRAGLVRDPLLIPAALELVGMTEATQIDKQLRIGRIIRDRANLMGVYSRREMARLYDETFQRHDQPSFPPRSWIYDHDEQTLLVQVDTRLFVDAEAASRAFQKLLAPPLAEKQLEVHIYPKISEESFWSIADEFVSINEVTFEYATPNMFGQTKAEMTAYLKRVRESTNANVLTTKFVNDEGKLQPKKNGFFEQALDWVKDGGGSWRMKGRLSVNSRAVSRSSGKQAKIYVLPDGIVHADVKNYSAKDLMKIIHSLKKEYTYQ